MRDTFFIPNAWNFLSSLFLSCYKYFKTYCFYRTKCFTDYLYTPVYFFHCFLLFYITVFTGRLLLSFFQVRWILKITDLKLAFKMNYSVLQVFFSKVGHLCPQIWCYNFIFHSVTTVLKIPIEIFHSINNHAYCLFLNIPSNEMLVLMKSFANFLLFPFLFLRQGFTV